MKRRIFSGEERSPKSGETAHNRRFVMGHVSFVSLRKPSRCIKREKLIAWKERYISKKLRNYRCVQQSRVDCPRENEEIPAEIAYCTQFD
jgi:hypothetical protein